MKRRVFVLAAGAASVVSIVACSTGRIETTEQSVPEADVITRSDTLAALQPRKRKRPVVAILADNQGSETTDLIVPWSVLKRSDAADVIIASTQPGDIQLMPALRIRPDMTIDQFDEMHPEGADYVIVPAFHDPKNRVAGNWLRQQSATQAIVAGVCSGALVLAHAGLLADRRATTHWYDRDKLVRISPTTKLQLNNRYLADRGVATTTGVSASLPFALTLVEAILGRSRAEQGAAALGLADFGQSHDSTAFQLKTQHVLRVASNFVSGNEQLGMRIDDETDELELAFVADSWSRTYRSKLLTFSDGDVGEVASSNGIRFVPDLSAAEGAALPQVQAYDGRPANALASTLSDIADRYGMATARLVALQLEYAWES